jgi:hypothetical protein
LRDEEREASIEAGYVMRACIARMPYLQAALANVAGEASHAGDDAEDAEDLPAAGETTIAETLALAEEPPVAAEPQTVKKSPEGTTPVAADLPAETKTPPTAGEIIPIVAAPTDQAIATVMESLASKESMTNRATNAIDHSPIVADAEEEDVPLSPEEWPATPEPGTPPLAGAPRRSITLKELAQKVPPPAAGKGARSMADLLQKKGE